MNVGIYIADLVTGVGKIFQYAKSFILKNLLKASGSKKAIKNSCSEGTEE